MPLHVSAGGTWWRSWLRHCATSQKVVGSIPDGVTGIFHWHNPSGRTMALGLTQPLPEMSDQGYFMVVKAAGAYGWQPYHLHVPIVLKSGSLNLQETSGSVLACNGIALPCGWWYQKSIETHMSRGRTPYIFYVYQVWWTLFNKSGLNPTADTTEKCQWPWLRNTSWKTKASERLSIHISPGISYSLRQRCLNNICAIWTNNPHPSLITPVNVPAGICLRF